jgi:hypothetical protein
LAPAARLEEVLRPFFGLSASRIACTRLGSTAGGSTLALILIVKTSGSAPHHRTGAVVHQLGDRAGADRADIGRLVAHCVEHGLVAVEDLLVVRTPQSSVILYFNCFDTVLLGMGKQP